MATGRWLPLFRIRTTRKQRVCARLAVAQGLSAPRDTVEQVVPKALAEQRKRDPAMQAVVSTLCENMQAQSQGMAKPVMSAATQPRNAQAQGVLAQQIESVDRTADALVAAAEVLKQQ